MASDHGHFSQKSLNSKHHIGATWERKYSYPQSSTAVEVETEGPEDKSLGRMDHQWELTYGAFYSVDELLAIKLLNCSYFHCKVGLRSRDETKGLDLNTLLPGLTKKAAPCTGGSQPSTIQGTQECEGSCLSTSNSYLGRIFPFSSTSTYPLLYPPPYCTLTSTNSSDL